MPPSSFLPVATPVFQVSAAGEFWSARIHCTLQDSDGGAIEPDETEFALARFPSIRTFFRASSLSRLFPGRPKNSSPFLQPLSQNIQADAEWASQPHSTSTSYKTVVCKFWHEGKCKRGGRCSYLHEGGAEGENAAAAVASAPRQQQQQQQQRPPRRSRQPTPSSSSSSFPSFKTRMCKFFEEGVECAAGDGCKFAHGRSELREPPRAEKPRGAASGEEGRDKEE